jgi:hypothetical protein
VSSADIQQLEQAEHERNSLHELQATRTSNPVVVAHDQVPHLANRLRQVLDQHSCNKMRVLVKRALFHDAHNTAHHQYMVVPYTAYNEHNRVLPHHSA